VEDLVSRMREAGELLRGIVESDDRMSISRRLLDVAHRVDQLREDGEPQNEPVPIESLGFDDATEIVPIETLAPDQPAAEMPGGLERSFKTFGRLLKQRGTAAPSIDVLLGHSAPQVPTEEPAIAIDTLCYRGQAALERAVAVRHQIAAELARDPSLESLQPLLQELLDLVPLALVES
jgi:hypothetical protein